MLFASTLASHADTTTDNLLNNPNFTTDTSGWELSDNNQNKVKRDPMTYSGSASKSVRFRYQGGNISQDVDISGVSENHLIKEINMNFDSIGCGNTGSQWCTAGADDTVVSTITLSTESTAEVLSETIAVPYEDGWENYSFTKDVTGDFNTDDTSLNLTITGNDTGNSGNWWGPIIDNLSLSLTIEEYVAPVVVEPIVVEPIVEAVIEPIVVIEETLIEGLSLDTEIVNDVILQPVAIEVPTLPDLPDLPEVSEISPEVPELSELPEISMDIEIPEISVDVSEISIEVPEIEVVEEIQEIEVVNEPVVEEIAEVELETPEELKEQNMEEDMKESQNESEQTAEAEVETDGDSELSESDTSENTDSEPTATAKNDKNDNKKEKKSKKKVKKEVAKKTADNKSVAKVDKKSIKKTNKPSSNASSLGQIDITTMVYLQVIPQTITIQETVSLTQEMIYEQDIGALASSATYDNLIGGASRRWVRMVDVRPKHTFGGYGR